jgi:hypothetical protein
VKEIKQEIKTVDHDRSEGKKGGDGESRVDGVEVKEGKQEV